LLRTKKISAAPPEVFPPPPAHVEAPAEATEEKDRIMEFSDPYLKQEEPTS